MKYLVIISFFFISFGASAQKANFRSENATHPAGIHTQFNCSLAELAGQEQLQSIVAKMKATQGLLKLDVLSSTENSAELRIVTNRQDNLAILEKAFANAGIKKIAVDNKNYKTTGLGKALSAK